MLGHSGGTLYKCRFTWLQDYEAVQFDKGFSERGYRGTLFRKKARMSCLTATKMRGQGVTTSFARARRACETSSAAQRSAAQQQHMSRLRDARLSHPPQGRSLTFPYTRTHAFTLRLDQVQGAWLLSSRVVDRPRMCRSLRLRLKLIHARLFRQRGSKQLTASSATVAVRVGTLRGRMTWRNIVFFA